MRRLIGACAVCLVLGCALPPASAHADEAFIQVMAGLSIDEARAGAKRIAGKHHDVVSATRGVAIEPVAVPGRGTFIRVLFGPVGSNAEAERLCATLQSRGQSCIVRRAPLGPSAIARLWPSDPPAPRDLDALTR
jgi:hypothetical protein